MMLKEIKGFIVFKLSPRIHCEKSCIFAQYIIRAGLDLTAGRGGK